ncbi:hypothetical protein [Rhodomicrobium lacus]|uniref:hypothetical protein n=1 Tax=Rhodomicrobium lacus TaxID=2498452 RepID=UPI0026E1F255|nr:hypothetical protein [Rhodomicrobium lacus]WKW50370.1 hypothetical protein QMO75_13945 [Rhodomicrobium lacus]
MSGGDGADAPRGDRRFVFAYALAFAAIVLFTVSPMILAAIASAIAKNAGCAFNEGSIHPCVIAGEDWGSTLYTMAMMGWLAIATIQIGAMAFAFWFAALVVHGVVLLLRRGRSRN